VRPGEAVPLRSGTSRNYLITSQWPAGRKLGKKRRLSAVGRPGGFQTLSDETCDAPLRGQVNSARNGEGTLYARVIFKGWDREKVLW